MWLDPTLLDNARKADTRVAELERALEDAKAEYRLAVKQLHISGGSLRDIAEALSLSHQRVHQIVKESSGGWPALFGLLSESLRRSRLKCSFCRAPARDVQNLIAGPRNYICDRCIALGQQVVETRQDVTNGGCTLTLLDHSSTHRCSFCGKLAKGDRLMVSGTGGRICNDCLDYCGDILREEGVAG